MKNKYILKYKNNVLIRGYREIEKLTNYKSQ